MSIDTPIMTSYHRARIFDLWDAGQDTFDIAIAIFGDRRREADVHNELASIKGETEPHPRAKADDYQREYRLRSRQKLREIRGRHA